MKYILLLISSLCFSEGWSYFHHIDMLENSNEIIDYEYIDSQIENDEYIVQRTNLSHKVIGYLPYWKYDTYQDLDYSLLTEINYFSAELNPYGNIINDHNWSSIAFIDYAQERGVKVKLCATLFGATELSSLLGSQTNRENAITNLLFKVLERGADGIDIDFELVPSAQRSNLVLFMSELATAFHENMDNPIITMATPAVDWSNSWDYNQLAQITDGLFIMGYNYFYAGSSQAGPISPLGGYFYDINYTIDDYLSKTDNQIDKLILGLPYYGYDWPVLDSFMNSETTNLGIAKTHEQAMNLKDIHGNNYNSESNAPWISYNSSNWQQCWYEDSLSISTKYSYAKNNNLAGVGIWALGYDNNNSRMWGSISDQFSDYIFGDFNYDGIVNVIDIVELVNSILSNYYLEVYDLNNDAIVNVLDVLELVSIVLDLP